MSEPPPEASPAEDDADRSLRVVASNGLVPQVDENALRVISRLDRHGFQAYLVGGCVRDLMLGRSPKDFDVATAAHPRQIKRLFRNGRIIGRRFRLVHVVYGDHVVETATFRSEPLPGGEPDDLLITEDNEYGTAVEDARRRDFTINALFLDPLRKEILDYVGGLEDLEAGLLRTIGEPLVRIAEDPVRIVRAVKFATRLGFRIEEETWRAMCELAPELSRSAPPRVVEEIVRLLRSGTALGAFRMLRACGALRALLPEVDGFLGARNDPDPVVHDRADSYWRLLEALDAYVHEGHVPTRALCMAVLYLRVIEQRASGGNAASAEVLGRTAFDVLQPLGTRARVARRVLGRARQVIANQPRFTQPPSKNFKPLLFMHSDAFVESLSLFRLRSAAWGQGWDVYEGWTERYRRAREVPAEELERARTRRRGGKRRRRRRRGRGTSETSLEAPEPED